MGNIPNLAAPSVGQSFLPATPITAQTENRSAVREKISAIKSDVCRRHGITEDELISAYRARRLARARFDAAYQMRVRLGLTLSRIGKELGGRSVRTVMYCIKQRELFLVRRTEDIA